jgi:class 3 adenylate cyclase
LGSALDVGIGSAMANDLAGVDSIAEAADRSTGAIDELVGQKLPFANSAERATRAILIVDVVESVRLIEQDEEGVIVRWLKLVNYVEADLLAAGEGRLVKYLGDGMLLAFEDVRKAVSAALAIQNASKRQNFGVPLEYQILLRIGSRSRT